MILIDENQVREIQKQAKEIGLRAIKHNPDSSEWFARVYRSVFGRSVCTTCPGKIEAEYQKLVNLSIQKFMIDKTRKYNLKKGMVITNFGRIPGVPRSITNANLTDEIAEAMLSKGPEAWKKYFEPFRESEVPEPEHVVVPEAKVTTVEELAITHNRSELIAMLKELKVTPDPKDPEWKKYNKEKLAALVAQNQPK